MKSGSVLKRRMAIGYAVFGGLIVVKVLEFVVSARLQGAWPLLILLALAGTGLILFFFMHLAQLGRRGGER